MSKIILIWCLTQYFDNCLLLFRIYFQNLMGSLS